MRSGFFNSVGGDRKYDASFFAQYFASFIGNGVFPNPSDNLQVIANNDMTVTVGVGKAWINGYVLFNDEQYNLSVDVADGTLKRIDRVVARFDTANREITVKVKKGAFGNTPSAPDLQRDANGYELALADIFIDKGAISITQADITDTRLNNELCGVVSGVVEQVDTTTLYNQYTQGFEGSKRQFEQDFNNWFNGLQDLLDENTAGNLLNLINQTEASLNNHLIEAQLKHDDLKYSELTVSATNRDVEDIYVNTEWKRKDNTTYAKSTLLGTSPKYNQIKVDYYDEEGLMVEKTITWALSYDDNDFIYKKEVI